MARLISINNIHSMEFLLSFLFLYFATTPATCLSNETDFSALLAFKNGIIDDPLGALRSWNQTVHFCDWDGILCSRRHRSRAVSINLRSQGLEGFLSPHLGTIWLALSCVYIFLHRRRILRKIQSSMPSLEENFLRLSYADLLKATDRFSEANLLGSGKFGSVYSGFLDDKQTSVAVKVLNLETKGASKSFMSECNAIKGIIHRNLLKILSVCESIDFQGNNFKALVYEFMANGSLEKWLHNDCVKPENASNRNLTITQKLNIVIDVAAAVDYLHHGTNSIVMHGDLKPSNILLDENLSAHVGDFGLATVVSNIYPGYDGSSSSVAIKGTLGYIPPEYGMSNNMTTQGDVYSFGILMVEMFTNIRPTDNSALNGQPSLHHLVSHALQNQEMNIVDQIILHEHTDHNMYIKIKIFLTSLLEIGVACSMDLPKDRMGMTDVVSELDKIRKAYFAE